MKKLIMAIMAAATLGFSGCEWDESAVIGTATSAGSIAMLTWFSIDDPPQEVKNVLKEVVGMVTKASVDVGAGKTYFDTLLPVIQEFTIKQEKLNDYQKTLINAGSVVILNGIDTLIAQNPKVKKNSELVNKVVAAFGQGCLTILNMGADAPEVKRAKGVYAARSLKYRDGRFVAEPKK